MNLEEELKIYRQTIQFLDESTDDYLYIYDFVNDRIYFTDKIFEKYGLLSSENGVSLSDWNRIVYAKDAEQLEKNISAVAAGLSDSHDMEYRLIDKNGNTVWICCRGTVIREEEGKPVFLMGSISEQAMERKVDNLTGLWNYEKFMEDMGHNLRENQGYLMVFGVDNFKNINVKNGRTFGNRLLKIIVTILEEKADGYTKLYRLDGDRFAVDFPWKKRAEVSAFYRALKKALDKYCTISAGVVDYNSDDREDSSTIYQYAENALDRAKREGKNKIVFFSFQDYQKNLEKIRFQDELRMAVSDQFKGFYLCYQPQINSSDFSIYGAEALLRYRSAERGMVSPVEFIPFLEQTGMICLVGEWVLRTALRQCVRWREQIPDFRMSVNISYVQLRQENITGTVLDILRETGLPGSALTLEVTESMQLQDYSYFNKIFYEWKRHGIKIAIDDFGTGYSSLSYLKSIDVDETKIDRCFVNRIYCNAYNYCLLRNIIELAHCAKIEVCCEGVETEEELLTLQELNPDMLQGFLFARPYTEEEFEKTYLDTESENYMKRIRKENNLRRSGLGERKKPAETYWKDEIINIVEEMDDVIYVSDAESHELYYMNPAGRKRTGIYDYKGLKCYQVLQGRNKPCKNCNNEMLSSGHFRIWEVDNEFLDEHFIVRDKLIPWKDKTARLEVATEVAKKEELLQEPIDLQEKAKKHRLSWGFNHRLFDRVSLGVWLICIDETNGKNKMYTDDVMNRIMGLKEEVGPEECYDYWYERIDEKYKEYVDLTVENIIQKNGKAYQMEYIWKHPEKGDVPVRCAGIRAEDHSGVVCIQGYHRILSDLEQLKNWEEVSDNVRRNEREDEGKI